MPKIKKSQLLAAQVAVELVAFGGLVCALLVSPLALTGMFTTVTSLAFKVWGQPAQLLRLHRLKTSEGLSWVSHAVAAVSYVSWTIYGLRAGSWVIVASQSLGVVGSILTLHLIIQYRLHKPTIKLGVMLWLWSRESNTWEQVTADKYIVAFKSYRLATSPWRYSDNLCTIHIYGTPETTLPLYWSTQANGELLQGIVTDANVPQRPTFVELVDGMRRLEAGTLVYSTKETPARLQYVVACLSRPPWPLLLDRGWGLALYAHIFPAPARLFVIKCTND